MRNLLSFYKDRESAEQVKDELVTAGFSRGHIGIYGKGGAPGEDERGMWERIKESLGFASETDQQIYAEATRRGEVGVGLELEEEDEEAQEIDRAVDIMRRHQPVNLREQEAEWRQEGWTGQPGGAKTESRTEAATGAPQAESARNVTRTTEAIPVIEEQLQVGKRRVELGGVRVHSRVVEQPVEADVALRQERVKVERRPADRPATDADRAFEDRTIEATESREEAVISKEARVVEEVSLKKEVQQQTQTVRDKVRKTDVQVEQAGKAGAAGMVSAADFANEVAMDNRYLGRDWDTIEPEVRATYEQRYPTSKWESVKDAIRGAFTTCRSRAQE